MTKRVPMISREFGEFVRNESYVLESARIASHSGEWPATRLRYLPTKGCGRFGHSSNPPAASGPYKGIRALSNYRMYAMDAERVKGYEYLSYNGPFDPNRDTFTGEWSETLIENTLDYVWHPYGGNRPSWSSLEVTNLVNRCRTKALLKLANGKAQAGVALAEAKKGLDGILSRSHNLAGAIRAVKRGNFKGAARILGVNNPDKLAGAYLEYTYGWEPLISDIMDYGRIMLQGFERKPIIRAVKRETLSSTVKPTGLLDTGGTTAEILIQCGITAELDDTYARTAQQLGLINPLSIGWELIPLSFLIDWTTPLGDFFEAMSATAGLKHLQSYTSATVNADFEVQRGPRFEFDVYEPPVLKGSYKTFERIVHPNFPKPMPYIESPFSSRRCLTVAALIKSMSRD